MRPVRQAKIFQLGPSADATERLDTPLIVTNLYSLHQVVCLTRPRCLELPDLARAGGPE